MNLLHLISSIIMWTAFYATAENDPRNNEYARSKRNGILSSNYYQPSYYYPHSNYYSSPQSNYYPSNYYSPYRRSSYYPSSYHANPSKYYYYPQAAVAPTPGNVIKSILKRQDGPLNPFGYEKPKQPSTNRPIRKKKKLFVANVWG